MEMTPSPTTDDSVSQKTDPNDCQICYQDLTRKTIAVLACGHQLHRSCLLLICESHEATELHCPACDISFSFNDVRDEFGQKMPKIIGYGPTAQPSKFLLAKSLEISTSDVFLAEEWVLTEKWLQRTAIDIDKANENSKDKEFLQDLLQEREKLLRRAEIIREMQKERAEIEEDISTVYDKVAANRWQLEVARNRSPNESIVAFTAAAAAASEQIVGAAAGAAAAKLQEPALISNDEISCGVCLETLSSKRTVKIGPCKHTFHQTCVMRWFESQSTVRQGEFSCCNCRTKPTKMVGQDGHAVLVSSVFEAEKDNWFCGRAFKTKELMESMTIERSTIIAFYYRLSKQRRLARKDKRGEEWIADIDEEMSKMRRRIEALDNFYFIAALTRKMDEPRLAHTGFHRSPAGPEGDNLHAGAYAHAVLSTHTSASFGIGGLLPLRPMPWPLLPHSPSWSTPLNFDRHNPDIPASRLFAPSFPLYNADSGRLTYTSGLPYDINPFSFVGQPPAVPGNRGPVSGAPPATDRSAALDMLLQQPLRNLIERGMAADPANTNSSAATSGYHPYMRPRPPIPGTIRTIPNGTRNSSSASSSVSAAAMLHQEPPVMDTTLRSNPATGIPNSSSLSAGSPAVAMPANHHEPSHVPASSAGLLMVRGHCACADCTRVY